MHYNIVICTRPLILAVVILSNYLQQPTHCLLFLFTDCGFVMVARNSFWVNVFQQNFLDCTDSELKDDLVFYVRKNTQKSRHNIPQVSS